jgi:glycosyltransferase involved in cell wall biosynthesis
LRLTVVSPFLDRQHGTELCITEQIEHLADRDNWEIHLYAQRVQDVRGLRPFTQPSESSPGSILWHRVSNIRGPHLLRYLWWFLVNQSQRNRHSQSGKVCPDLTYSPGINCWDADVIVVHIVFHAFYDQVRPELAFSRVSLRNWPLLIHRKLYYKLIMFLERRIYRSSNVRLIAVSSHVAAQLKSYFQCDAVCVIPNAVDTVRFTPQARIEKRNESRRSFSYDERDFVLLLIGNDWKKKGLDSLLRALAQLATFPLRLLVVGSDNPGLYRQSINQFGLQHRVRFEKPSPDVVSFYAAADLYAAPSLEDAFNLPILEAMSCGLPVIASAETGASDLIRDGETGFILADPRDHLQLANLIRRVHTDRELRIAIGEAASRYVLANCGWEQNAEKTRKFLEDVFQRRHSK